MKKILWIDTETTGLDPTLHSMIQIAGIIDIDGEIKQKFNFNVRPHPDFKIDEEALKITKLSVDEIQKYPEMTATRKDLINTFSKYINRYNKEDKFIIAGQNIKFDIDILSHFFYRLKDFYLGSYINFRERIELWNITSAMKMLGFIQSESLSLEPLCHEFNIAIQAHDALSDIEATREIYYTIVNNLIWNRKHDSK